MPRRQLPGELGRTVAAVVFDWDGTAVADRQAPADAVRRRVEALSRIGVHTAIVSGTHLANIDGQLQARPHGPGRLFLALNRGSEVYAVTRSGPELLQERPEDAAATALLDVIADRLAATLGARGLEVAVVGRRVNRRKIDLIPGAEWENPPKARIASLAAAVTSRLQEHGLSSIAAVVDLAQSVAKDHGLDAPRITSDAKHVEVGVTDKGDSMRALLDLFADDGVGPGLVLLAGDEFGELGGVPGSDARMLVPEVGRATVISVGVEPAGVPAGVSHLPGGPATFLALLDEQLHRAATLRTPDIDRDPRWLLCGTDALRHRVTEALFTLGSGGIATRGAIEEPDPAGRPMVLANGVYAGAGPTDGLLPGPVWTTLDLDPPPQQDRRLLDLRTGVLLREEVGVAGAPYCSVRFASAARPGLMALRAECSAGRAALASPPEWAVTTGRDGGGIGLLVDQTTGSDGALSTVQRLVVAVAEPRSEPRRAQADAIAEHLGDGGFELLLSEHRAAWAQRWNAVDIRIPTDPETEAPVRFALFQLWTVAAGGDELAVGARGLSGPAYSGHVFWDADVFVLPALMTIDPAAATAMVRYRLNRLPAAREWARAHGLSGARFPWESGLTGADVTPVAGVLGAESVPIYTGEREEHITADVAWAAVRNATWSRTDGDLDSAELTLLADTARYWAGRARLAEDGRAHIERVIGPDEYHERVDDNAYTNVMARWNLEAAAERTAGLVPPEERARWRALAAALVDGYDETKGVHEQFAGYLDLEPLVVTDIARAPVAADLLAGRERVARSQLIKQSDVLMLHLLVPELMPAGSLARDLDLYAPRTAHGSSLSPAMMAAVMARAGRPDEGLEMLRVAARVDIDDTSGATAAGLHIGAAGGVWQAVVFGFLGASVDSGVLRLAPALPRAWPRLEVRMRCLGTDVRVEAGHDEVTVAAAEPIRARHGAGPVVVVPGGFVGRRLRTVGP